MLDTLMPSKQDFITSDIANILQKVHFSYLAGENKTLAVVSELRQEGKSTLSLLIAKGLSSIYGLTVAILDLGPDGDALLNKVIKSQGDDLGFDIHQMKHVSDERFTSSFDGYIFNRAMARLSDNYDFVIVDTFTLNSPQDLHAFHLNADSFLMVCSSISLERNVNLLSDELKINGKNVLGVVLNVKD